MAQLIAFCQGSGGTGKSVLTALISKNLANKGSKVLVIDFCAGLRRIDAYFNVADKSLFDLCDVLGGRAVEDAVITATDNLHIICAPQNEFDYGSCNLDGLFSCLGPCYDYILAVLPDGINSELISQFPSYTRFIIVTRTDNISLNLSRKISDTLDSFRFEPLLIINFFEKSLIKKGVSKNLDDIIDAVCAELLGIVPYDRNIGLLSYSNDIANSGCVFDAVNRISDRLEGQIVPLPNPNKI